MLATRRIFTPLLFAAILFACLHCVCLASTDQKPHACCRKDSPQPTHLPNCQHCGTLSVMAEPPLVAVDCTPIDLHLFASSMMNFGERPMQSSIAQIDSFPKVFLPSASLLEQHCALIV